MAVDIATHTRRTRRRPIAAAPLSRATLAKRLRPIAGAPDAPASHEERVIQFTVRANILSGRVSGLMRGRNAGAISPGGDLDDWLRRYVARVRVTFARERDIWQRLAQRPAPGDVDPLLARVESAAAAVTRMIRSRYADADPRQDELINDVYVMLRGKDELLAYPFDAPLDDWLKHCVWRSAKRLYDRASHETPLTGEPERMLVLDPHGALDAFDDDWMSVKATLGALLSDDRVILDDWLAGVRPEDTGRALGMSPKTVYARRKRIVAQLQGWLLA